MLPGRESPEDPRVPSQDGRGPLNERCPGTSLLKLAFSVQGVLLA